MRTRSLVLAISTMLMAAAIAQAPDNDQTQLSDVSWRSNQPQELEGLVALAPNPAFERVQLLPATNGDHLFVEFFDERGARVLNTELRGATWVELAGLAPGGYVVRVSDDNGLPVHTERLVVSQ